MASKAVAAIGAMCVEIWLRRDREEEGEGELEVEGETEEEDGCREEAGLVGEGESGMTAWRSSYTFTFHRPHGCSHTRTLTPQVQMSR